MRLIKGIIFITLGLFLVSCNTSTVDYVEPSLSPTPKPATEQVEPNQTPTPNSVTQQFWQTMDAYRAFDETLFVNATGTAESAISTHIYRNYQRQTQTATPSISVTPSPTITPRAPETEFKVIYREKDFVIREKYLGGKSYIWDVNRIETEWLKLGFDEFWEFECIKPFESTNWCTKSIQIESREGNTIYYEFDFVEPWDIRPEYFRLKINGKLITGGHLDGGTCSSISHIRQVGDGIAIEYRDAFYSRIDKSNWIFTIHSIIITEGDSAIDIVKMTEYKEAFAPFEIQGKLLYFARDEIWKSFIVFDGKEVGSQYDRIFDFCCCDGPRIIGNRYAVDFIAYREGAYYHVQAGDPDYFEGDG